MTVKRATGQDARLGRYRLCGRLAAGGMAEVWAAQLLAPGGFVKPVVIKRVLPELAAQAACRRMLITEARVSARLSHANVCSVFELVEVDNECFIAMEFLRGAPLSGVLRSGAVPAAVAVALVAQACDGLHYAHEQPDGAGALLGLVHRDVSPGNLFITVDGVVKVLDFGIVKVDDGLAERTEAGKIKGKLSYMSPEQLSAAPLDRRTDVWALGVVLWELLTGKRLFGAGGPADAVNAISSGRVPTLYGRGLGQDAERLDAVLSVALRVERAERFATAAELRRAMVEALAPTPPATREELAAMTWERCGDQVRANDRRFEDHDARAETPPITLATLLDRPAPRAEQAANLTIVGAGAGPPSARSADGSWPEIKVHPAPDEPRVATAPALEPVVTASLEEPLGAPPGPRWKLVATTIVVVGALAIGGLYAVRTDPPPPSRPGVQAQLEPRPQLRRAEMDREPAPASVGNVAAVSEGEVAPPTFMVEIAPALREPLRRLPPKRLPPRSRPASTGKLSVDARPWATIYADGKKLGVTPIIGRTLTAGKYTLKAVTEDGRTQELRVTVPPDGSAREMVTW